MGHAKRVVLTFRETRRFITLPKLISRLSTNHHHHHGPSFSTLCSFRRHSPFLHFSPRMEVFPFSLHPASYARLSFDFSVSPFSSTTRNPLTLQPALSSGPIIFIANRLIHPLHFALSRSRASFLQARTDTAASPGSPLLSLSREN